jgi:hypothetical protein
MKDEFDGYLEEALKKPSFAKAYAQACADAHGRSRLSSGGIPNSTYGAK